LKHAHTAGFDDPRVVNDRPLGIGDARIAEMLDGINFYSATYRLFKIDGLEPECEDYGQAVIYKGGVEGQERVFILDKGHHIEAGRVFPICGNSWKMLADTRFAPYFDFVGDFSRHFGVFPGCGSDLPFTTTNNGAEPEPAACC
jgi:arsenite methyltransferase